MAESACPLERANKTAPGAQEGCGPDGRQEVGGPPILTADLLHISPASLISNSQLPVEFVILMPY